MRTYLIVKKDQNFKSMKDVMRDMGFEVDTPNMLEVIEIIENLEKNAPKNPNKNYKKKLEYYKKLLSSY